ncbi:5923_t:CDS:1, partial [Racocetra persica]
QEDPRIRMGIRQLKQRLESMETNYKYVSQLTKQQTNEHIQEIEKVTNRKISEAETAEDKKAYLYKTISALTETKDAILWKKRDLVKDLEEEYGYATNQALTLDRKDFEAMEEYKQRILMERFARQMKLSKSEPLRQQLQAKYRELLGVSLENLDKMHDTEDEEKQMFEEQIKARKKGLELPETLPLKNPYNEEYRPTINEPRDVETLEDRWLLDSNFGRM